MRRKIVENGRRNSAYGRNGNRSATWSLERNLLAWVGVLLLGIAASAQPAFVSSGQRCVSEQEQSPHVVHVPRGLIGELLIWTLVVESSTHFPLPADWKLLARDTIPGSRTVVKTLYRVSDGSEPTSYILSCSSCAFCSSFIRYTGVDMEDPIGQVLITNSESGDPSPVGIGSLPGRDASASLLAIGIPDLTIEAPEGKIERMNMSGTRTTVCVADELQAENDASPWKCVPGNASWFTMTVSLNGAQGENMNASSARSTNREPAFSNVSLDLGITDEQGDSQMGGSEQLNDGSTIAEFLETTGLLVDGFDWNYLVSNSPYAWEESFSEASKKAHDMRFGFTSVATSEGKPLITADTLGLATLSGPRMLMLPAGREVRTTITFDVPMQGVGLYLGDVHDCNGGTSSLRITCDGREVWNSQCDGESNAAAVTNDLDGSTAVSAGDKEWTFFGYYDESHAFTSMQIHTSAKGCKNTDGFLIDKLSVIRSVTDDRRVLNSGEGTH